MGGRRSSGGRSLFRGPGTNVQWAPFPCCPFPQAPPVPLPLVAGLLRLIALYLLAGVVLLPWLCRRAWPAAAPGAHGASWGFWLAAFPGTLLLWPVLLFRARHPAVPTGEDPRRLRRAQSVMILLAGLVVVAALMISFRTRPPRHTVEALPAMLTVPR